MEGAFVFSGGERENLCPQVLSGTGEVPLAPPGQDVQVSPGFISTKKTPTHTLFFIAPSLNIFGLSPN